MHLKLYIWILALSILGIFGLNLVFLGKSGDIFFLYLWSFLNPIVIFALDALIATVIHHTFIPQSYFSAEKKRFSVSEKEMKFYRKIRINSWKDLIPETGKLTTGLSKGKIESTGKDYLKTFITETCYAEVIHIWMSLAGFIPLIASYFFQRNFFLSIALPHALINFLLNIPPILIQRNNRPKLLHMYMRETKKRN